MHGDESLVLEYLDKVPSDSVIGEPIKYLRFVDGGRCRIWAPGWDEDDDGGKRIFKDEERKIYRPYEKDYVGDWVWSYKPTL